MHVIKVAIAVVVSKCNNDINYQNCNANIGINLRNNSIRTYSSGSNCSNKNTSSSSSCKNNSINKIDVVVVINIFFCVAFELVE